MYNTDNSIRNYSGKIVKNNSVKRYKLYDVIQEVEVPMQLIRYNIDGNRTVHPLSTIKAKVFCESGIRKNGTLLNYKNLCLSSTGW